MAINLFHSRRTSYALCKYWKRKTNGYGDANELIHNEKPSGYFYAKTMSAKNKDLETLQGVMMYDKDSLTLKTTDDVKDLKAQDIIEFRGSLWFVDNVQVEEIVKQTQFNYSNSFIYYLSIRK